MKPFIYFEDLRDNMNHLLCILKSMESGITLVKDLNGSEWKKRDVRRMMRKSLIEGYDIEYDYNWVTFNLSEIQYVYIIPADEKNKHTSPASEGEEPWEDGIAHDFPPNRAIDREPEWKNGNGVMFR